MAKAGEIKMRADKPHVTALATDGVNDDQQGLLTKSTSRLHFSSDQIGFGMNENLELKTRLWKITQRLQSSPAPASRNSFSRSIMHRIQSRKL